MHFLQWFIADFSLFCNVFFFSYFAVFHNGLLHIFALFHNGLFHILQCFTMVYCIFCIAGGSWCDAKRGGVADNVCWWGKSSHCPPSLHAARQRAGCWVCATDTSTAATGCNRHTNSFWGAVGDEAGARIQ